MRAFRYGLRIQGRRRRGRREMGNSREVLVSGIAQLLIELLDGELAKLSQGARSNLGQILNAGGQLRWTIQGRLLACSVVFPDSPERAPVMIFELEAVGSPVPTSVN